MRYHFSRRRPVLPAFIAAFLALVTFVGACSALPESGPVYEGIDDLPSQAPVDFVAQDPRPGDEPIEIVRGFLDGVTAGLGDEFAVARKYLSDSQASVWNPSSAVMIYSTATPRLEENDAGQVVMSVQISGTIDAHGVYSEAEVNQPTELIFDVEENADGEWRISGLADGMVISEVVYNSQFLQFDLYFFSPDHNYFVPDQRYFPSRTLASYALRELSVGPAEWMAQGVVSAVPAGVSLSVLRVSGGVAYVEASQDVLNSTTADRSLMAAQIQRTLTQLAQVREVEVSVAGAPLLISSRPPLVRPEPPMAATLHGRMDEEFYEIAGGTVTGPGTEIPEGMRALTLNFEGNQVWGLLGQRNIALLQNGEAEVFYEAPAPLVSPVTDYWGWVWTGATKNEGTLQAVDISGEVTNISAAKLADHRIRNISVSRDGTRIAIIIEEGEDTFLAVAPVIRDRNNRPTGIGPTTKIAPALHDSHVVTWVDNVSIVVLGRPAEMTPVHLVTLGGRTTVLQSLPYAHDVAGNELRGFYVSTNDGDLFARSDLGWQLQSAKVSELIYPG